MPDTYATAGTMMRVRVVLLVVLLSIATASEGADADMTEIVKPLEKWAGVRVGR